MNITLIIIHALICILLTTVILMQSGRGGGLTEGFASAESMFGAKTNVFLIKTTTVMAVIFLTTCLSLAFLSSKRDESLMPQKVAVQADIGHSVEDIEATVPLTTNSVVNGE